MLGKTMDGQKLLALFALLMLVVAGMMFRSRGSEGDPAVVLNRGNAPKLLGSGAVTGLLSGFFGIGGGFLVVPGMIDTTGMSVLLEGCVLMLHLFAFWPTPPLSHTRLRPGAW